MGWWGEEGGQDRESLGQLLKAAAWHSTPQALHLFSSEEEVLGTRYQTAREAWAQRIQAASQNSQADFGARSAAMPTGADPGLGIARSLLSGATRSWWNKARMNGCPTVTGLPHLLP